MKELLRPKDLAPLLGVTPARVYQLIAKGELPGLRLAGSVRVPREAWERWLREANDRALAAVRGVEEGGDDAHSIDYQDAQGTPEGPAVSF